MVLRSSREPIKSMIRDLRLDPPAAEFVNVDEDKQAKSTNQH